MRFLLDENLPSELNALLQSQGHDTLLIGRSIYRSPPDTFIWSLATRENRILVTKELDFPLRGEERSLPGLILIRGPDTFTGPQITDVFAAFMSTPAFNEVSQQVIVVSPGRSRARNLQEI